MYRLFFLLSFPKEMHLTTIDITFALCQYCKYTKD